MKIKNLELCINSHYAFKKQKRVFIQKLGGCCFFRLTKSHDKSNNRVMRFKQQNAKLAKKVYRYVSEGNGDAWLNQRGVYKNCIKGGGCLFVFKKTTKTIFLAKVFC